MGSYLWASILDGYFLVNSEIVTNILAYCDILFTFISRMLKLKILAVNN